MDIVLAIPMKSKNGLPAVKTDRAWQNGTLSRVTASGTPGEQVVNLISREFPRTLRDLVFERSHINLWDAPIEVSGKKYLKVVGLEFFNNQGELPNICLIHFEVQKDFVEIDAVSGFVESITRLWRKESQALLADLFISSDLIDELHMQGLGIIGHEQTNYGSANETRGHVLVYTTKENEPKLIHAYGAHVIAVVALQQFSLDYLNFLWPKNLTNRRELLEFSQKFLNFRHKFNWTSLFINSDARRMYRNLRDSLNIEKRYTDYGDEIREALAISQGNSSLVFNKVAAVVAISALIPIWIPTIISNPEFGIVGLVTTAIFAGLMIGKK
jgi:hypothetical protein